MKKGVCVTALALLVSSYGVGHCATNGAKGTASNQDQSISRRSCQSIHRSPYSQGSGGSQMWLGEEEAICRSQNQYPEYQEALKVVPGKEPGDEQMRRLLVVKEIWQNDPLNQGGVLSVEPNNFMESTPKEVSGLRFGSTINADSFISSYTTGQEGMPVTKRTESDYLGNRKVVYSMYRRSDFFMAYHFSDGWKTIKIVPSDDPKLPDEIKSWNEANKGFLAKVLSNKKEYNTSKPVDALGLKLETPSYIFDDNDKFVRMRGFLCQQEKPSLQLIAPKVADAFDTLIQQFGEPALKAKHDKMKLAIWLGKDGTRIDFLCWDSGGYCNETSFLVVQKIDAATDVKASSKEFFK